MGGDAADEIVGKVLDQADAAALRRKVQITRDAGLRIAVGQKIRRKIRGRTEQIDMLDAAGDLGLGRLGEFKLVKDIPRFAGITIRVPQPVEECPWIVRTRRRQLLMSALQAERRRRGICHQATGGHLTRLERRRTHRAAGTVDRRTVEAS